MADQAAVLNYQSALTHRLEEAAALKAQGRAPKLRTFMCLHAGSTTITPSGRVIRFGGRIEQVQLGVKTGHGTHVTDDLEEIAWLEKCVKSSPTIWEVIDAEQVADPAAAAAKLPAAVDAANAAGDVLKDANRAVNPAITAIQAKLGTLVTSAAAVAE